MSSKRLPSVAREHFANPVRTHLIVPILFFHFNPQLTLLQAAVHGPDPHAINRSDGKSFRPVTS